MNNFDNQKFKNKFRIKSMRLAGYDYSQDGAYFITICAKDKENFFGKIINREMELSKIGDTAKQFWHEIETLHDFIILDENIIMPNHLHGIIFIQNPAADANIHTNTAVETRQWRVSTTPPTFGKLPKKSIASIINHYKGAIKKWANNNGYQNFCWQKNYYDRIIRNEDELNGIRKYIQNNPANWEGDGDNLEIFLQRKRIYI
ncbi:MAG: transposase [archaeon]